MLPINSDEKILSVLKESNEYLESNPEISSKIGQTLSVFNHVEDLLPQTIEKALSGHIFPLVEAEIELKSSIQFCKLGFYKHSLIALRNALELGLLSVYWDIDGQSHIDIQEWLHSFIDTPIRKRTIFPKLKTNQNIKNFDDKHKILDYFDDIFKKLSNFVHTKGRIHSSWNLANANFNRFNEKSFLICVDFLKKVVTFVVIIHVLKYPIALQHIPLYEKFGLNPPVGGFLESYQSDVIKNFLDKDKLKTLQEISDLDEDSISIVRQINERPDISEEEIREQEKELEKLVQQMEKNSS